MSSELELPPGFRFHPTDEELVNHYLCRKCASLPLAVPIIKEIDLYKYDPWQLPGNLNFQILLSFTNRIFDFYFFLIFFVKFWDMGLLSLTSIFLKLFISEIGKQIDSFFGWGVGVEFSNQYFKIWILFSVLRNGFAEFGKTFLEFLHFLLNFPTWYIVRNQKKAAKSSLSNSFLLWIL